MSSERVDRTTRLIRWAILSRMLTWAIGFLAHLNVRSYDASGYLLWSDIRPMNSLERIVVALLGMFANWDGMYFIEIAENGYSWDKQQAFFPLLPVLARYMGQVLQLVAALFQFKIHLRVTILLAMVTISNVAFVLAAVLLYRIGLEVLKSPVLSYVSAILFVFTPASVFMSACYTESLFCLLSFSAFYCALRGWFCCSAGTIFAAGLCRSNGILLCIPYAIWTLAHLKTRGGKAPLQKIAGILIGAVASVMPYFLVQWYAYSIYCRGEHQSSQDNRHPLCESMIPNFYHYVQDKYWDVGWFRYYQWKQTPNFVLATPCLAISILGIRQFIVDHFQQSKISTTITRAPFIAIWIAQVFISITIVHIQVSTRFISTTPAIYWYLAEKIQGDAYARRWMLAYSLLYFTLGPTLFCIFLPWT